MSHKFLSNFHIQSLHRESALLVLHRAPTPARQPPAAAVQPCLRRPCPGRPVPRQCACDWPADVCFGPCSADRHAPHAARLGPLVRARRRDYLSGPRTLRPEHVLLARSSAHARSPLSCHACCHPPALWQATTAPSPGAWRRQPCPGCPGAHSCLSDLHSHLLSLLLLKSSHSLFSLVRKTSLDTPLMLPNSASTRPTSTGHLPATPTPYRAPPCHSEAHRLLRLPPEPSQLVGAAHR